MTPGTVLKSFPYAADGTTIVTLDVGKLFPFPDHLFPGLEEEGFVVRVEDEGELSPHVVDPAVLERISVADRIAVLVTRTRAKLPTADWDELGAELQLEALKEFETEAMARLTALDHDRDGLAGGVAPSVQQTVPSEDPTPSESAPGTSGDDTIETPAAPEDEDNGAGDGETPADGEDAPGAAANRRNRPRRA